jgi:hypothetical protein
LRLGFVASGSGIAKRPHKAFVISNGASETVVLGFCFWLGTLHYLRFVVMPRDSNQTEAVMAFSNDIVLRAQADLQRAERDAANARDKLARSEADINDLRAFLRKLEHYASPAETALSARTTRSPRGSGGKARRIADFCIEQIAKADRRLEMSELFPLVLASEFEIGGTDEKSVLAGYLSRDPRVNFARGEGWGITTDDGAASMPDSEQAAPVSNQGGTNDGPTLILHPVTRTDPFS